MSKTIYKDPTRFYVYAFLREDGSPYYIGKDSVNRAWVKRKISPDDVSRISILFENLTETEAFDLECELIQLHGRKDLGTGILRNRTDGGEGASGYMASKETLDKISAAMTGKQNHMYGKCQSPETIAKGLATRKRNKEAKEALALHFSKILNFVQ